MDFMQAAERIGIPMSILMAVGFAVWRIIIWLGEKVITPITASHIALVEETKKSNTINSETLRKMTEILEVKAVALTQIANSQLETLVMVKEIHSGLKKTGG